MRKIIGVSGGKGGTGKTFIATNVALMLTEKYRILLVDADVENPNVSILLNKKIDGNGQLVTSFFPRIDASKCTHCGACADACRFHALFQMKDKAPVLIDPLCKSCQLCMRVCEPGAISADMRGIGELFSYENSAKLTVKLGRLFPGDVKTARLISVMNEQALQEVKADTTGFDFVIIDCAPGAHCDVEKALKDVDVVFCVTEPTPLGAHDLKRTLQLAKFLKKPAKIIINRADMVQYDGPIERISDEWGAEIIARIPLSREVMETYARGESIFDIHKQAGDAADHPVIKEFARIIEVIEA
nr:P-loop NTPase [Candidatus Sigynarchaeum springense]